MLLRKRKLNVYTELPQMKIAYIRTQFWFGLKSGGSVGHTLGILNGFRENGCKVEIISNEKFLGINDFNYTVIEPKIKRRLGELLYNFYVKNRFKEEILKFNPDFIYHRYTGYTFFIAEIAQELKIPLILEFNSFGTWTMKYWTKSSNFFKGCLKKYVSYNIVKRIESYNLRNASLISTVSRPLKMDLLKMGIRERRILVNPNSVDPEKFNPEIEKNRQCRDLKRKLGIDYNKIVVGFSGTFGPWHGIPQLTEAIDKILKSQPVSIVHFLLVGDGELKPRAEDRIGHYKEVTFVGEVSYSDVHYYLAICDVLVSPHNPQIDRREFFGSPTKLFEYMAMGKAIVASNLGQIGDILKDGETAILVEPGNVDTLVDGILKLVEDSYLREKLGHKAREEVVENYTWQKNIERLIRKLSLSYPKIEYSSTGTYCGH